MQIYALSGHDNTVCSVFTRPTVCIVHILSSFNMVLVNLFGITSSYIGGFLSYEMSSMQSCTVSILWHFQRVLSNYKIGLFNRSEPDIIVNMEMDVLPENRDREFSY